MDSQCKFGVVARGQASLYLRLSDREQKIWDIAPGTLVVEEAGGQARGNCGVLHFGRAQGLVLWVYWNLFVRPIGIAGVCTCSLELFARFCIFASNIQLLDTLGGTQHHPTPLKWFGWLVPGLDEFLVLSQHSSHLQSLLRLIIRQVSDSEGRPLCFSLGRTVGVRELLASNGTIHGQTLEAIAACHRPWRPPVGHGRLRKSCACWEGKCWQMIHWIWWKADPSCFYHVDEHEDGNLIIFESCKCTRIIFRILAKNPHRVLLLMMRDTIIGDWVPLVNHKIDPAMSTDLPGQEQIKQPNSCVNMESMIDLGNTYRKSVQLGSMQGISWACVDLLWNAWLAFFVLDRYDLYNSNQFHAVFGYLSTFSAVIRIIHHIRLHMFHYKRASTSLL